MRATSISAQTRLSRRTFLLLFLISTIITASAQSQPLPAKRDYANRIYYAVQLADETLVPPPDVADLLGVRLEGRVGELKHYFLYSAPKTELQKRDDFAGDFSNDPVLQRLNELRKNTILAKRDRYIVDGIHDVAPQKLRRREKRVVLPEHLEKRQPDLLATLAHQLQIPDPGLDKQWHL
ncbi:hypothetical protein BC936DRAFT_142337, partial [Jimgerdemannia flammicorona]